MSNEHVVRYQNGQWRCRDCGATGHTPTPPHVCPAAAVAPDASCAMCGHPATAHDAGRCQAIRPGSDPTGGVACGCAGSRAELTRRDDRPLPERVFAATFCGALLGAMLDGARGAVLAVAVVLVAFVASRGIADMEATARYDAMTEDPTV